MTMFGYTYWVPHGANNGPMVNPSVAAPKGLSDSENQDRPMLTDFRATSSIAPIPVVWQGYFHSAHHYNSPNFPTNMNHLFADGHVRTVPGRLVELRQRYHLFVWY